MLNDTEPFDSPACEAILKFLPVFAEAGFQFGRWHHDDDSLPQYWRSDAADDFVKTLYETGWIVSFDWQGWQDEAARYVDSKEAVRTADLGTLQKLLTTHVRKDRFCEGHLAAMFECGHLTALVRRMHTLQEGSASQASGENPR